MKPLSLASEKYEHLFEKRSPCHEYKPVRMIVSIPIATLTSRKNYVFDREQSLAD